MKLPRVTGREVVRAPQLTWPGGLYRAIRSPQHFGDLVLQSPRGVLYVSPRGKLSLVEALSSRRPSSVAPADVRGRIIVQNGEIIVMPAAVPRIELAKASGEIVLATTAFSMALA